MVRVCISIGEKNQEPNTFAVTSLCFLSRFCVLISSPFPPSCSPSASLSFNLQPRTVQVWGCVQSVWRERSVAGVVIPVTPAGAFAWRALTEGPWSRQTPGPGPETGTDYETGTWSWTRVSVRLIEAITGPLSNVRVSEPLDLVKVLYVTLGRNILYMYVYSYRLHVLIRRWRCHSGKALYMHHWSSSESTSWNRKTPRTPFISMRGDEMLATALGVTH